MVHSGTKGQPFSIRLSDATDQFVVAEANRTRRSKSAVVEMLTEEAARMRRFPGLAFRGDDVARRPWVIGTGLDVWQIVEASEHFSSPEEMADQTDLEARHVRLALAYRDQYPDEIAEAIAINQRDVAELERLYPFLDVAEPV